MKMNEIRRRAQLQTSIIISSIFLIIGYIAHAPATSDPTSSAESFKKAAQVLLHPRCVNCHPKGDHPLVGDRSNPHPMNVMRGKDGLGENGLWCHSCHQEKNSPGMHAPPGAPEWHLPAKHMPMVFEGRTPRQLCEQLKDPKQNGKRPVEKIIEHVREAPLVRWGWNPGEGRTPVPTPHPEFVKLMANWAHNGAACPD
jgi:hypothetical protein